MASLPQPAMASMPTSNPHFTLKKGRNTSTMKIGHWTIEATKKPILNGREIDAVEKSLNLPLPEMTFGNNSLVLTYSPTAATAAAGPSSSSSLPSSTNRPEPTSTVDGKGPDVQLRFDTLEALAGVAVGDRWEERVGGGVLVSMAEKWGKNRASPSLLSDTPVPTKPVKPHDWTYSTCYAGSVAGPSTYSPSPTHSLPMPLLARQDPVLDRILFYEDVPLFEDELHDNGESILNARIRVMPHSFFILARSFVRVDNVLFRMYDVRIYHAFGSDEVIREVSGMEVAYDEVKQKLHKSSDLSPLTNPNWVYGVMTALYEGGSVNRPGLQHRSSSRSGGGGKPWPGLGKRVDVLTLPSGGDVQETAARLASVRIDQ